VTLRTATALLATFATAACATEKKAIEPAPPPAEVAAAEGAPVERFPTRKKSDRPQGQVDFAAEVELKLLELFAQRRLSSGESVAVRGGRAWPEKIRSIWSRILAYLDDSLSRPPGDYPVPLILRTRVALDVELDETIARHGTAPPVIADAFTRVTSQLARHLHAPESPKTEVRGPELRLAWPLSPPLVTSKFGKRIDPIAEEGQTRFHAGLDLGAATGDVVVAAAGGRISFAGWLEGRGNTVVVQHGAGYATLYAHLSELLVENGARVAPGTPVGLVGSSGRATGPHLHFEVRKKGVPVDPETMLPLPEPGAAEPSPEPAR
jgi:murein DD-endopeptidase MepM/ murein hydrolase activator NlpD